MKSPPISSKSKFLHQVMIKTKVEMANKISPVQSKAKKSLLMCTLQRLTTKALTQMIRSKSKKRKK